MKKFELNNTWAGRIISIGVAAAVVVTVAIASEILSIKNDASAISNQNSTMAENDNNSKNDGTTVVPFAEKNNKRTQSTRDEMQSTETDSTTITTTQSTTVATTQSTTTSKTVITTTTTATTQTQTTSTTAATPIVSNGKREFNYDDVSNIAADLKTLEDFVTALNPTTFSWDTTEYALTGCVRVYLVSAYGDVTLDVKPLLPLAGYGKISMENQITGSRSSSSITDWEWYQNNKGAGCNISSVNWLAEEFAIAPVRDIKVGTSMTDVIANYLCVNGGATTLYKASDVITDQDKLNTLLAGENAYTFVGGRVYSIGSYLEKYYEGKENSYRFADCDYVIQYGCNSVMDYDYITGSWLIEYAIKDDTVNGITFMNKSYYAPVIDPSTEDTKTTSPILAFFKKLFGGE